MQTGLWFSFFSVWLLKSSWEKPLSIHPLSEKQRIATGGRKLFLWQAYKARFFSIFISPGNHLRPPCTMCTVSLIYPPPYFRVPTRWCWWSPRCTPTSRTGRGTSSAGTTPRGGQFNWDKKTMTRGLEIGLLFSFHLKVCPEKALHSFSCPRTGSQESEPGLLRKTDSKCFFVTWHRKLLSFDSPLPDFLTATNNIFCCIRTYYMLTVKDT